MKQDYRQAENLRLQALPSSKLEGLLEFWKECKIKADLRKDELREGLHSTADDQIAQIKAILAVRIGRSKKSK